MVESTAYDHYIDSTNYGENVDGLAKLEHLDNELRSKHLVFGKFVEDRLETGVDVVLGESMKSLWYKVSNDFLHLRGYVDKFRKCDNSDDVCLSRSR